MNPSEGGPGILTLEPLVEAVTEGVRHAGWILSGLQKTTSQEFEGRWAGESTRSAYLFFHREDLPEAVSVEAFLDETSDGLRGNLALVLDGPPLGDVTGAPQVLERVGEAAAETISEGYRVPLSVRLALPDGRTPVARASLQVRVKLPIPRPAVEAGGSAVSALASSAVGAFEQLLERPEVAELLPPVVE